MPQATFAECPECGAKVRKEKLRRHRNTVHGEGAAKRTKSAPAPPSEPTVRFPWRVVAVLAVAGIVALSAYWFVIRPSAVNTPPNPPALPVAVFEVAGYGTIEIRLDTTHAPRTAAKIRDLVSSGYYNGLPWHRVVPNFVIQTGQGSYVPPIDWERTGLTNDAHTVAMARLPGDPNSASSQFFINLVDNPSLDRPSGEEAYPYVVFGVVVVGHSVVDAIGRAPLRPGTEEPDPPVIITRAYIR